MPLLEVKNLKKIYTSRFGATQVQALTNVNFTVEAGEYIAHGYQLRLRRIHLQSRCISGIGGEIELTAQQTCWREECDFPGCGVEHICLAFFDNSAILCDQSVFDECAA